MPRSSYAARDRLDLRHVARGDDAAVAVREDALGEGAAEAGRSSR